jgi:hypothetical protein
MGGSTSQLAQAMAGFGGGAADTSATAPLSADTSQQTFQLDRIEYRGAIVLRLVDVVAIGGIAHMPGASRRSGRDAIDPQAT